MEEEILVVETYEYVTYALIASTGDILSIGECLLEDLASQAGSGETVVANPPVNIADDTHYYKNGLFKAYPAKPSQWHTFNYTTETWVDSKPTDVNAQFDVADYTIEPTFTVSGNTLSIAAFTALRDNGEFVESKAPTAAATITYVDKPLFVAYLWDTNAYGAYNKLSDVSAAPRRFLIGEFRASGVFIPNSALVNGGTVATNSVGTPQLAPLAVTATELALAAVGKDHLQKDSIVASKIGVTDLTNVIPDSDMKDADAWSWTTGAKWAIGNNPSTSSFTTSGHLIYDATGLTSGYSGLAYSKRFPVDQDQEYLFKYQTYSDAGQTHGVWGRVHWYNAAGGEVTPYTTIGVDTSGAGLRQARQAVKPPVNAKYGEMRFYVNHAQTSATVKISSLVSRVMANGDLIVDGAVKTVHLEAQSVTMSKVVITDFTNLVPNNTLADADYWWFDPNVSLITTGLPSNATTKGNIQITADITAHRYALAGNAPNNLIPIEEGEEYHIAASFRASGSAPYATPRFAIWYYDGAGNYISSSSATGPVRTNTGYAPFETFFKVPTGVGAKYARFGFGRMFDVNQNGSMYIENPVVRRKYGGNLVVDGSIKTNHLDSESVTTDKLGAKAVKASHIEIADFTNLVPDDQMQDVKSWVYTSTTNTMVYYATTPRGDIKSIGSFMYDYSANTSRVDAALYNRIFFPVTPGDVLYLSGQMIRSGGTKMRAKMQIIYYDKNDVAIADGYKDFVEVNGSSNTTSPYVREQTVPAGAFQARLRCYVYGTTAETDGDVHFGALTVRIKNKGEMIVDGSLTANHFNTTSMNTAGLAVFGGELRSTVYDHDDGKKIGWRINKDGTMRMPHASVGTLNIGANALYVPYLFTRADVEVPTSRNSTNQILLFDRTIPDFEGGGYLVAFHAFFDNTMASDSFGAARLVIDGSVAASTRFGVRTNSGDSEAMFPITMLGNASGSGTTNIKLYAYNSHWTTITSTSNTFALRDMNLIVSGSRR